MTSIPAAVDKVDIRRKSTQARSGRGGNVKQMRLGETRDVTKAISACQSRSYQDAGLPGRVSPFEVSFEVSISPLVIEYDTVLNFDIKQRIAIFESLFLQTIFAFESF